MNSPRASDQTYQLLYPIDCPFISLSKRVGNFKG